MRGVSHGNTCGAVGFKLPPLENVCSVQCAVCSVPQLLFRIHVSKGKICRKHVFSGHTFNATIVSTTIP
ncbi:hypothetical protein VNO78_07831 [Psophocarpus tetragonolobus]|uniref:Uncharacterized protein n=1 Tax=Psophocarpus tetragonolobus TaxID=3891 RepID=A0AAN9SU38_PSOTE